MTKSATDALRELQGVLAPTPRAAVAVSGGVDSMTLAVVAHRLPDAAVEIFHAVSPAVPPEATARVRHYADREGWRLQVVDAGEFDDPNYRANPVNRCFYCKTNLYGAIVGRTDAVVYSGTNMDDLGDYRPGLEAAANRDVRHPFVEADIDKASVRAMAHMLGLDDLAELPAAPCLSSRIETGLRVEADQLALVHAVERYVGRQLDPDTVRCRVRHDAIVIELDGGTVDALPESRQRDMTAIIARMFRDSAFLRPGADG
jgi:uncharacterized protein